LYIRVEFVEEKAIQTVKHWRIWLGGPNLVEVAGGLRGRVVVDIWDEMREARPGTGRYIV
jgi:hypothetical protein